MKMSVLNVCIALSSLQHIGFSIEDFKEWCEGTSYSDEMKSLIDDARRQSYISERDGTACLTTKGKTLLLNNSGLRRRR